MTGSLFEPNHLWNNLGWELSDDFDTPILPTTARQSIISNPEYLTPPSIQLLDAARSIFSIENSNKLYEKINKEVKYQFSGLKLKQSLANVKSTMSGGAIGYLYSCISKPITGWISETMKVTTEDVDGIDFTNGIDEGDFKVSFSSEKTWTGNGSSKKRGQLVLFKFLLAEHCPIEEITVNGVFCCIIPTDYVTVHRAEGNSDRADMKIHVKNIQHAYCIKGKLSAISNNSNLVYANVITDKV